jgi:LPXTG-motif cell wall-anchored protein
VPGVDAVYRDVVIPAVTVEIPGVECPEVPVDLPEECPDVVSPENDNIGAISLDCPITLPKPDDGEIGTGVSRPRTEVSDDPPSRNVLPHTGADGDDLALILGGLGLIALGGFIYVMSGRDR